MEADEKKAKLLIVDDNETLLASMKRALGRDFIVDSACDVPSARRAFSDYPEVVLLDIRLDEADVQNQDGVELLKEFLSNHPEVPIVMISAYGDMSTAVECMRVGAADFIEKPANINALRQRLKQAIAHAKLSRRAEQLEERLKRVESTELIGETHQMQEVKKLIQMVAQDGYVTVLIRGETGTGKELVARAIHRVGIRSGESFVPVAIASLNPNVVESELFGHEAGAFTGATGRRIGFIEKAKGGVLFLDEIGDLPSEVQLKLLRFLEERTFTRLGSSDEINLDVQIVAATNRDLEKAIAEGLIREDLYFRLKSVQITLPPLRERFDDLPLLVSHFLERFIKAGRTRILEVDHQAMESLSKYHWPGNVRELKAALERAVIYANTSGHEKVEMEDLPLEILGQSGDRVAAPGPVRLGEEGIDLEEEATRLELAYIEEALNRSQGRKTEAWKLLGLNDRFALRRKVLGIKKKFPQLLNSYPVIKKLYTGE